MAHTVLSFGFILQFVLLSFSNCLPHGQPDSQIEHQPSFDSDVAKRENEKPKIFQGSDKDWQIVIKNETGWRIEQDGKGVQISQDNNASTTTSTASTTLNILG